MAFGEISRRIKMARGRPAVILTVGDRGGSKRPDRRRCRASAKTLFPAKGHRERSAVVYAERSANRPLCHVRSQRVVRSRVDVANAKSTSGVAVPPPRKGGPGAFVVEAVIDPPEQHGP